MNEEQIRNIIDGTYDEQREEGIGSLLKDFYNKRMLSIVVFLWIWAILFVGLAIFSAIKFLTVDQTRYHIMFAAIFLCACQFLGLIKIFAWQMIHRNSIKREIKRLELRIAALAASLEQRAGKN